MPIILILFLAAVLRFINLNQSFWLDEAISAITAQKPFPYQWIGITKDVHPPLYYLIVHFFMQLGNFNEWFLRIPSLAFGILTVWVVYQMTDKLFDQKTAVLASILLSTSQFHIYYSQELRMYSLFCLLGTLSMWTFYHKKWLNLTLINIIGLYTHYMFGLLFIPQLIWIIHRYAKNPKIIKIWILSIFLSVIAFIPWFPSFIMQLSANRSLMQALPSWKSLSSVTSWKLFPQIFLKFTLGRIDFNNKYIYLSLFIGLVIFYSFLFLNLKNKINEKVKFILIWIFSPILSALIISFYLPIDGVWRFLFLLPPFLILVSLAISESRFSKFFLGIILLINAFSITLYWTMPKYQRENWKDAVAYMDKNHNPVIFVVENGFAPYQWYSKVKKQVCGPISLDDCLKSNKTYYVSYLQELFDPKDIIEAEIKSKGFSLKANKDFSGVGFVKLYENSF